MVLVDTSVLIGYLKGAEGEPIAALGAAIDQGIPFGICPLVYQETLQGARDQKEFDQLKKYLGSLRFYDLLRGKESYEAAAHSFFRCRKAGLTIRSTIDLVIAQVAIENDLALLHDDSDFIAIAKVVKELRLFL
jgi:hypothetical protein